MTDPIADMLTRIRNINRSGGAQVDVPKSKIKLHIAEVLKREGYIEDFRPVESGVTGMLRIYLKKEPGTGRPVIRGIDRTSKPGRRLYLHAAQVKPVLKGMGISILSTPKGVLSDRECRHENVGGEVLCTVW